MMTYLHWTLFETIDEDLLAFSRQVEFAEANFPTYSVYLSRLYLTICSEIDVVAKLLCERIDSEAKAENINEYRDVIGPKYPNFSRLSITIRPMGLDLVPWEEWQDWKAKKNPSWWSFHNDVKHQRDKYFHLANLGNVLQSASGLLVLLTYYHQPELYARHLKPHFRIFEIDRNVASTLSWAFEYNLPDFGKRIAD